MIISKESLRGFTVSAGSLWIAAFLFAVAADQHYDGIMSREMPSGAPRNFLDFQSHHALFDASFLSALLVLHWAALARKEHTLHGFRTANAALILALLSVIVGWFDKLMDNYYQLSLFCFNGGERITAFDVGWACETSYYTREFVLPTATLLLLILSFIMRLVGGSAKSHVETSECK